MGVLCGDGVLDVCSERLELCCGDTGSQQSHLLESVANDSPERRRRCRTQRWECGIESSGEAIALCTLGLEIPTCLLQETGLSELSASVYNAASRRPL